MMLGMLLVDYNELDLNAGKKKKKNKGSVLELLNNFVSSGFDCVKVKDTECYYDNYDSLGRCIKKLINVHGLDNMIDCFIIDHEVYLKRKRGDKNGKNEQGSNNSALQSDK